MGLNVVCGECMCLVPMGRWLDHLTYHEAILTAMILATNNCTREFAALKAANVVRKIQVVPQ